MRLRPSLFLIAFLSQGADLLGQDQRIDVSRLPRTVDTFHVSYAGNTIGRGILARSNRGSGAGAQLLQVYTWRGAGYETLDSLFTERTSLRPIREVRIAADTVIEVRFRGDSAKVEKRAPRGPTTTSSVRTAGGYASGSLDAVVSAAPLSVGYSGRAMFYYAPPSPRGTIPIAYKVTGSSRIRVRGTEHDAWVVSVDTPDGGTVYWIDKTTRSVLQFDTREGNALIEFRR